MALLLQHGKDKAIAKVIETIVGFRVRPYGRVDNAWVNSVSKEIRFSFTLKGENEPLELTVYGYHVLEEAEHCFLCFERVETSREWMNTVIDKMAPLLLRQSKIEIPKIVAGAMKIFL